MSTQQYSGCFSQDAEEGSKRKRRAIAQGQKACNPCRARKVRCSYQLPCQTCVDRQHPQLCVYDAPLKRVPLENANAFAASTLLSPGQSVPSAVATPLPLTLPQPQAAAAAIPTASTPWNPSESDWEHLLTKIDKLDRDLQSVRRELSHRPAASTRDAAGGVGTSARYDSPSHDDEASVSVSDAAASAGNTQDIFLSVHPVTGEQVFLGANSVPAMAVALSQQPSNDSAMVRDLLDKSVLPIFTLENESTTYPFVDLWGLPHASPVRVEKLCSMLPSDSECLQYIRQYRDIAHVLFPAIVNIQQFEVEVTRFLVTRTTQPALTRDSGDGAQGPTGSNLGVYGKSVHWLGLLFACLASGYQCSNLARRERQLTSQVYVCCAYECLRIVNYLSCCQLDDIQNLLVLGNVISNSMNAGVAWSLLGLTIRLAQGLGLNHEAKANSKDAPTDESLLRHEIWTGLGLNHGTKVNSKDAPTDESLLRHEIWTRIIWQDSLLSISYDRVTPTGNLTGWDTAHPTCPDSGFSYVDCMLQLCTIALDVVRRRAQPVSTQHELQRIEERRRELQSITDGAHIHLRESSACALMKDHLEHWNWRMHYSYVVSELCRPMLAKREQRHRGHEATTIGDLRRVCINALVDTVGAFLKLQNLTIFARTSWAAVHRSLGSALLLGILKEPAKSEAVRLMIDQLITVMSNIEYTDASEIPAPVTRAVEALQRLNIIGNRGGGGGGSGHGENQFDFAVDAFDHVSPPTTSEPSSGDSPHAQMHRILWGGDVDMRFHGVGPSDFFMP